MHQYATLDKIAKVILKTEQKDVLFLFPPHHHHTQSRLSKQTSDF